MIKLLNLLSVITGRLVWLPLPWPLRKISIRVFIWIFSIDTKSAEKDFSDYKSIGEFFSRRLKSGSRNIQSDCVSPIDGTLRDCGIITSDSIPQIKGRHYSLKEFVGSDKDASRYLGGSYYHFYLSPKDYHRIHFPVSGVFERSIHFPGTLLPVNDRSWSSVDNLFVKNERVVSFIDSKYGVVCMVLIGALNVGGIELIAEHKKSYDIGHEFGMFKMGSAVVLLFEKDKIAIPAQKNDKKPILYGQSLLQQE